MRRKVRQTLGHRVSWRLAASPRRRVTLWRLATYDVAFGICGGVWRLASGAAWRGVSGGLSTVV